MPRFPPNTNNATNPACRYEVWFGDYVHDMHCRAITKAAMNGLAPLLEGSTFTAGEGVGLLQVLNTTASLEIAAAPAEATATAASAPKAAAVALTLRDGSVVWGEGQELWLSLGEDRGGNGGGGPLLSENEQKQQQKQQQRQRGSARYDFLLLSSARMGSADGSSSSSSSSESVNTAAGRASRSIPNDSAGGGSGVDGGGPVEEEGRREEGRGLGLMGGHVVGELRPLNEFSAARQEALDQVRRDETRVASAVLCVCVCLCFLTLAL